MSLVQVSLIRIYNQLNLTGGSFNFLERTFSLLLRNNRSTGSNSLSLFSFSGSFSSFFSFFVFSQFRVSSSFSVRWFLTSSFFDQFQRSTDNSSLVLDGLSGSLFSSFF